MARADAEEGRHGGGQAHSTLHGARIQAGRYRQDSATDGRDGAEETETPEEYEKRIDGYAEAIVYFLDHPDAPLNPVVRAFIESVRKEIEVGSIHERQQATLI